MTTQRRKHPWLSGRRKMYRPEIRVSCTHCGVDYDEREVEVLDIEENILGEDVLQFRCPEGHETRSLRRR